MPNVLVPGQSIEQEEEAHLILTHIITRHMGALVQKKEMRSPIAAGSIL